MGREFAVPLLARVLDVNGVLPGRLHDLQALDCTAGGPLSTGRR